MIEERNCSGKRNSHSAGSNSGQQRGSMPRNRFECRQCGNCCLTLKDAFAACATEADVSRWEEARRDDILEWVDRVAVGDSCVHDIWINPATGEDVSRCPWLRKVRGADRFICRIHDVKPDRCRRYPLSRKHAERTGSPAPAIRQPFAVRPLRAISSRS
jgi:Fe-S-cluster containining protein